MATPLTADDPAELGGYRLAGRLGEGGQGVVYLAHTETGEPVAIKLLATGDPETRARLARELEALEGIASFCTARVLHASTGGARPYVVSEFIDGPSLADRVRLRGPLAGGDLERVAVGTATALAAIHAAGIVHRDFKPANVLLGPDGLRVVDFGIARAEGAATVTSGLIGTPAYLSPEQIGGAPASAASDVFAWAATVLFAATGANPFGADTVPAVLHRVLHADPDLTPLPPRLRGPIAAALAKDPSRRPTAQSLMVQLVNPAIAPYEPPIGSGTGRDPWNPTGSVTEQGGPEGPARAGGLGGPVGTGEPGNPGGPAAPGWPGEPNGPGGPGGPVGTGGPGGSGSTGEPGNAGGPAGPHWPGGPNGPGGPADPVGTGGPGGPGSTGAGTGGPGGFSGPGGFGGPGGPGGPGGFGGAGAGPGGVGEAGVVERTGPGAAALSTGPGRERRRAVLAGVVAAVVALAAGGAVLLWVNPLPIFGSPGSDGTTHVAASTGPAQTEQPVQSEPPRSEQSGEPTPDAPGDGDLRIPAAFDGRWEGTADGQVMDRTFDDTPVVITLEEGGSSGSWHSPEDTSCPDGTLRLTGVSRSKLTFRLTDLGGVCSVLESVGGTEVTLELTDDDEADYRLTMPMGGRSEGELKREG